MILWLLSRPCQHGSMDSETQSGVLRPFIGSKNREKSRKKLAKLHARISNIRKDSTHKLTTYLCKNHAVVAVEDLHVAGMLKNHHLAQTLADSNFGEIKRQLAYKAVWYGAQVVTIDRWYASSKTCSMCGWVNENFELSQRVFVCLDCGYFADRDYNAAKNILKEAQKILAASSVERLNACGAGSSGLVATLSETT